MLNKFSRSNFHYFNYIKTKILDEISENSCKIQIGSVLFLSKNEFNTRVS